jgi:hypothetical protein
MYALENTEGVPGTADGGASRNVIDMRSAPSPQKRLYPKTLTVFLDASPSGKHRAVHAAALAQRWDAHLIGVHVVFAGVRLYPPSESWAIGERAFQAVITHESGLVPRRIFLIPARSGLGRLTLMSEVKGRGSDLAFRPTAGRYLVIVIGCTGSEMER